MVSHARASLVEGLNSRSVTVLRFLHYRGEVELVAGAAEATKPHTLEAVVSL
jgi:hypothetical protein